MLEFGYHWDCQRLHSTQRPLWNAVGPYREVRLRCLTLPWLQCLPSQKDLDKRRVYCNGETETEGRMERCDLNHEFLKS